jgi:ATP-dependent exoDNAse (exonuclease V) beta subunit
MPAQPWQELYFKNPHPRDASIVFDEPTHIYTVNGTYKGWTSTTGFLHEFFGHFDAKAVIAKMMKSSKWPQSKYFGKTAQEIEDGWSASGKEASEAGTAMHLAIEQFVHGHPELIPGPILATKEWKYFTNFWRDHGGNLEAYRSEWEVWSEEYKLAGSIDMIYKRKNDGFYEIYDWKRSKEIKKDNSWDNGLGPVNHLPDCNYWHYTLQLNIYKWFLETYYGLKVVGLYLVIMHPDNDNYHRYRLNELPEEIEGMLACRLAAVEKGGAQKVII